MHTQSSDWTRVVIIIIIIIVIIIIIIIIKYQYCYYYYDYSYCYCYCYGYGYWEVVQDTLHHYRNTLTDIALVTRAEYGPAMLDMYVCATSKSVSCPSMTLNQSYGLGGPQGL